MPPLIYTVPITIAVGIAIYIGGRLADRTIEAVERRENRKTPAYEWFVAFAISPVTAVLIIGVYAECFYQKLLPKKKRPVQKD